MNLWKMKAFYGPAVRALVEDVAEPPNAVDAVAPRISDLPLSKNQDTLVLGVKGFLVVGKKDASHEKTDTGIVTRVPVRGPRPDGYVDTGPSWLNHPRLGMGRQSPHFVQIQGFKQKAQAKLPRLFV